MRKDLELVKSGRRLGKQALIVYFDSLEGQGLLLKMRYSLYSG